MHIISKKKQELQEGQMHLRVHRVENEFDLIRNIFYFIESNGNIFNDCIILQYFLDRNICGNAKEAKFKVASHGNSSSSNDGRANAFYLLKKVPSQILNKGYQAVVKENSAQFMMLQCGKFLMIIIPTLVTNPAQKNKFVTWRIMSRKAK